MVDLNKRLSDRRVTVTRQEGEKEWVAEKGHDSVFGARPLKRFLQRHVETKLARSLIAGEVGEGSAITFIVWNDELAPVQDALGGQEIDTAATPAPGAAARCRSVSW
jgi:ATP-dependent Clp protease ATP-binding subunit ClpB